jgi:hypothetical protein
MGKTFECAECGQPMQKIGMAQGQLTLSPLEVTQGVGPAEECRECGRAYCVDCYPQRPNVCVCGLGQDAVRVVDNVVYKGSLVLIKVRYF